jgi:hypothetical protein
VLPRHLACGFSPISGTLFRKRALDASGFVDADCTGNYPFECNIFLRLGEIGAKAWFAPRQMIDVRFHSNSLRRQGLLQDPALVQTAIKLWSRFRYAGALERQRRRILARYLRADALIKLNAHDGKGARRSLAWALTENIRPGKAWLIAPLLFLVPGLLRAMLQRSGFRAGGRGYGALNRSASADSKVPL